MQGEKENLESVKIKDMKKPISKENFRIIEKMIGVERITRKRCKKILMGCGLKRNDAELIVEEFHKNKIKYTPLLLQITIELINKEAEIKEGEKI